MALPDEMVAAARDWYWANRPFTDPDEMWRGGLLAGFRWLRSTDAEAAAIRASLAWASTPEAVDRVFAKLEGEDA